MNKKYVKLFGAGHLVTDIYQGAVPAMLPFLIADKGISYAAAAFLIFAANASSSIIQPIFGVYSDKISVPWALGTGILLGGIGIGFSGVISNYVGIFLLIALSGIGIALFHPEGARLTNKFAGENKTSAVSIFAAGGNIGFAVGPILTTTLLMFFGLKGTIILAIPAIVMGIVLLVETKNFSNSSMSTDNKVQKKVLDVNRKSPDEWRSFGRLTLTLLCRSVIFFGLNTFLTLYWMDEFGKSEAEGSIALSALIIVGAIGTLFAGKLADKIGNKKIIITGYACLFPLLLVFLNVKNPTIAALLLIPTGVALYSPYSPMVALGQKYLPNHVGLASGITLGLGVTMGGLVSPLLGIISDNFGIHSALSTLLIFPIIAVLLARKLKTPLVDIDTEDKILSIEDSKNLA
ncbi:MAG: MFS transporter [Clostridiales bacterium]|nr:MFS transporter [Clostridiales bacterium]